MTRLAGYTSVLAAISLFLLDTGALASPLLYGGPELGSFEGGVNPPVVSGAAATNDTTPTWSWSGGGGGTGTFRYQLDGEAGAWTETVQTSHTPWDSLLEGPHTLYVQERDGVGNWSPSGSFAITVDTTPPQVLIGPPSAWTSSGSPISYTVTYTGADTITLNESNVIALYGPAVQGTVVISGEGPTRTVTIGNIWGQGTVALLVFPGTATDAAGNVAEGAGPSAPFEVIDAVLSVSIGAPSSTLTRHGPVSYPVTYVNAASVSLAAEDVILERSGTASASVAVTGPTAPGENVWSVVLSNISGDGTLSVSIGPDSAVDNSGMLAPAVGPGAAFTVDNTPPVLALQGSTSLRLAFGTPYVEPGATAVDSVAGNRTSAIVIEGATVDTQTPGVYVVTYRVSDPLGNTAHAERVVEVLAEPELGLSAWPVLAAVAMAGVLACRRQRG
jgi:hypothetical protein